MASGSTKERLDLPAAALRHPPHDRARPRQRNPTSPTVERALRQAARELLLAQSSDWAFLIKNKSAPEYATERTKDHLRRFNPSSTNSSARQQIDLDFLGECEARANLFPDLNWRYYAGATQ